MPIYHNAGRGWQLVQRWAYASEDELERFLLDNPDFIAGERDDVWTVWARQIGARSDNQLDLLGLGSDGSITIVECKLGSNREERREVIAQVLEYASALWEMDLSRFREIFKKQHPLGRDPFDLLVEMAPPAAASAEEWEVAEAMKIAELNLQHGRLRLVVAVDTISERLRRIVDYVNSRGQGGLKIIAVAVPRYGDAASGVVAPEVYGDRAPAPSSRSAAQVYPSTEDALGQADPEMTAVVRQLHIFLAGDEAGTGRLTARTGKQSIGYDARTRAGSTVTLFRLWLRSGKKSDPPASFFDVFPDALAIAGISAPALLGSAERLGFEVSGNGLRLRPEDLTRMPDLLRVLDEEVLSRVDG